MEDVIWINPTSAEKLDKDLFLSLCGKYDVKTSESATSPLIAKVVTEDIIWINPTVAEEQELHRLGFSYVGDGFDEEGNKFEIWKR